jgi:hypothetical protein
MAFSTTLVGQGTTGQFFFRVNRGEYIPDDERIANYRFDVARPVPEPATVLLVGSCVAALAAKRAVAAGMRASDAQYRRV